MSGFLQALPVTLEFEGGFTHDTGGDTYQGVTQSVYDDWRRAAGQVKRPVKQMEEDERDAIYYKNYWVAAKCDKLPWPMSMLHFDCAVNTGVSRAVKILQAAVGAAPDGAWGADTQDRLGVALADEYALFNAMLWERQTFYYQLVTTHGETYKPYFVGWIRRVLKIGKKARDLW
jgi:lysozyme family protein